MDQNGKATAWEVTADDFVEGLRLVAQPKNLIKNVAAIKTLLVGLNADYRGLSDVDAGKVADKTRDRVLASFDSTVGVKPLDTYTLQYTLAGTTRTIRVSRRSRPRALPTPWPRPASTSRRRSPR